MSSLSSVTRASSSYAASPSNSAMSPAALAAAAGLAGLQPDAAHFAPERSFTYSDPTSAAEAAAAAARLSNAAPRDIPALSRPSQTGGFAELKGRAFPIILGMLELKERSVLFRTCKAPATWKNGAEEAHEAYIIGRMVRLFETINDCFRPRLHLPLTGAFRTVFQRLKEQVAGKSGEDLAKIQMKIRAVAKGALSAELRNAFTNLRLQNWEQKESLGWQILARWILSFSDEQLAETLTPAAQAIVKEYKSRETGIWYLFYSDLDRRYKDRSPDLKARHPMQRTITDAWILNRPISEINPAGAFFIASMSSDFYRWLDLALCFWKQNLHKEAIHFVDATPCPIQRFDLFLWMAFNAQGLGIRSLQFLISRVIQSAKECPLEQAYKLATGLTQLLSLAEALKSPTQTTEILQLAVLSRLEKPYESESTYFNASRNLLEKWIGHEIAQGNRPNIASVLKQLIPRINNGNIPPKTRCTDLITVYDRLIKHSCWPEAQYVLEIASRDPALKPVFLDRLSDHTSHYQLHRVMNIHEIFHSFSHLKSFGHHAWHGKVAFERRFGPCKGYGASTNDVEDLLYSVINARREINYIESQFLALLENLDQVPTISDRDKFCYLIPVLTAIIEMMVLEHKKPTTLSSLLIQENLKKGINFLTPSDQTPIEQREQAARFLMQIPVSHIPWECRRKIQHIVSSCPPESIERIIQSLPDPENARKYLPGSFCAIQ